MTSLILGDQVAFSRRSVDALVDVVSVLRKDDDLPASCDLNLETARSIKYIFDNLAWSDNHLSLAEIELLHQFLGEHEWLRDAYMQVEALEPMVNGSEAIGLYTIPNLIFLALDHDHRNRTYYAHMLVNALEMIAYGVIAADGAATDDELYHFRKHVAAMRTAMNPQPV
jgi:hypothetical protein